ncbi:hypothetical protein BEN30_01720 [Magnetovibrio blakemorei]|uniref:histidine kinase n=2 Tax=Magnetovibrio blakemorei TaxID=28181 RepID=A0A1E5Q2V3_9PROT|nr:hypothetical protein BEN30_01720 [Magnetovibrio blakemorei]
MLLRVTLIFMGCELFVMFVLDVFIKPLSLSFSIEPILDVVILGIIASPLVYFFAIRPFMFKQSLFRQVTKKIGEVFWMSDPGKSKILYISPAYETIWGRTCKSLYQNPQSFIEAICQEHRERVVAAMGKQALGGYDELYKIERPDGQSCWIWDRAFPVKDKHGNVVRIDGVAADITEQKETELELLRSEHDLSVALEKATAASKAKSEFLASMSHELRTPLNAILGFAQMMQYRKDEPLMPGQKEAVDIILTSGVGLLNLINEVLDLARIEADRATIYLDTVDAGKIVSDCVSMLTPLAQKRHIKIKNMVSSASAMLNTDPDRFKQMVINYITNAIKYNKEGGLITIEGSITDHGFFHLSVTDTGIGIEDKNLPKVFEIYNRFQTNPHITVEGTGVGLSVVKLLVERLAGNVGFESKINQGSTFWLELPLVTNKNVIIWTDHLSVGVDELDADHQWLVKLINKISSMRVTDEEINTAIEQLSKYFARHLNREEAVMKMCEYPDLEHHRKGHKKLTSTLDNIVQKWRSDRNVDIARTLRDFAREFLLPHILIDDQKYTKYIIGKEQQISDVLVEIGNVSNRSAEKISGNLESANLLSNKSETSPKKHINVIFVDDEQHVLDGLKRSLRGMSDEWNMDFVSEGEEALGLMETKPYDIIVSDMQMPTMSGEELLGKVEKHYPSTARVVLSGHVDQDATYRLVGSSHLFLSKPCSTELLIDTMRKSISLSNTQGLISN